MPKSKRLAAARTLMESLGALALAGSGAVTRGTTVLLTLQDLDQAVKKSGTYTPPGR